MKLNLFGNYHFMLLNFLKLFFGKLSLKVVENVAKVEILFYVFF